MGGGANPFIQKICKINNGCKSFNTRTIGSSPASRSTFLHTTCLRFQLHQSTNHDGQCQDSTSKNRKLAVSAEHRPDGEETKKDTQRGRSSRLIKKPAYALFFHVLLSIG
ncbi:hypothetical protein OO96_24510 [Escherichia coli]|nr:hypothetical protein OO96_24510 [Escherichia coli]OXL77465.1 hypothetical protein OA51_17250 [Escherichia coli]